jgi:hypothetical protein
LEDLLANPILLFDLDGVLVHPTGYRTAFFSTVRYFLGQIGLAHLTPGEEVPELFESFGVTSEWDMVPSTLACVYETILVHHSCETSLLDYEDANSWFSEMNDGTLRVDYEHLLSQLGPILSSGGTPSEALLRYYQGASGNGPLANLSRHRFLQNIFSNTRDTFCSPTTRVFQNFALGSQVFSSIYQQPAVVNTESTLEKFDLPAIEHENYVALRGLQKEAGVKLAAYTARPSLPPKEIDIPLYEYSPEAEMALGILDLKDIPMIGFGKLLYLAKVLGVSAEELLKPAPVQALAAIAAAWTGLEWPSLVWAVNTYWDDIHQSVPDLEKFSITLPDSIDLHIFEDSPAGLRAGRKAVEILVKHSIDIRMHGWGIARNPIKILRLENEGAQVFPDVNLAIRTAIQQI